MRPGSGGDRPSARTEAVVKAGADAVLVAPPRLGGSLDDYYARVAEAAGGAPVLAYHYPGVAGGEVPVAALAEPAAGRHQGLHRQPGPAAAGDRPGLAGRGLHRSGGADSGTPAWLGATGAIVAAANLRTGAVSGRLGRRRGRPARGDPRRAGLQGPCRAASRPPWPSGTARPATRRLG